jgi:hypothetical protein
MQSESWLIKYSQVEKMPLACLAGLISMFRGRELARITIHELSSEPDPPNGVYFIYTNEHQLLYIGKASSRSFVERIPAHFDIRENAWFNTLPKKFMAAHKSIAYADARILALHSYVVCLCIPNDRPIHRYETILRSYLEPKLNPGRINRFAAQDKCSLDEISSSLKKKSRQFNTR